MVFIVNFSQILLNGFIAHNTLDGQMRVSHYICTNENPERHKNQQCYEVKGGWISCPTHDLEAGVEAYDPSIGWCAFKLVQHPENAEY